MAARSPKAPRPRSAPTRRSSRLIWAKKRRRRCQPRSPPISASPRIRQRAEALFVLSRNNQRRCREMTEDDLRYLKIALGEAQAGYDEGGLPIGAVLVADGKILGTGRNRRVQDSN